MAELSQNVVNFEKRGSGYTNLYRLVLANETIASKFFRDAQNIGTHEFNLRRNVRRFERQGDVISFEADNNNSGQVNDLANLAIKNLNGTQMQVITGKENGAKRS